MAAEITADTTTISPESLSSSSSSSSSSTSTIMKKRPNLTSFEAMCVGGIGGMIETSLQMPLITWKICVQEGRAYPTRLLEWYRGVFINAGSLAPITAVQCCANTAFELLLTLNHSRKLSDPERLLCAASAGAISAFIYGPVDLLVIQQQKYIASLPKTLSIISNQHGILRIFRGLQSCMVRESIYTMGYLGIAPVVNNRLLNLDDDNNSGKFFKENKVFTSVISAMIGGSFAAVLTHPIDTSKTCMQSDLVGDKYPTARWTMNHLYQKGGMPVLFKGCLPRTLRLCGACFVISQVRENMLHLKQNEWGPWSGISDDRQPQYD